MEDNWSTALKSKSFRLQLVVSMILLGLVLGMFFFILQYAEARHGIVLEKGWLNGILLPHDFSNWIFACTYSATLVGLFFCFQNPSSTLLLIRTYLLLQFLRGIILLVFPLDPPNGIIPLDDPFLHATFYNGRPNLKDLFFSGHVATLVMFIPIISNKWVKLFLTMAALVAGILLAGQRVHYVIDIIAAPLFSILAFSVAKRWTAKKLSFY